jgi:hypothetical protein
VIVSMVLASVLRSAGVAGACAQAAGTAVIASAMPNNTALPEILIGKSS